MVPEKIFSSPFASLVMTQKKNENTAFDLCVADSLHCIASDAQWFVAGSTKKAFKHRIVIASPGAQRKAPRRRISSSLEWKKQALYRIRRSFYFQILKSDVKLKQRQLNNYCILRIGVPNKKEFLCRETFYVAEIAKVSDAQKFKNYWLACKSKSLEILRWLWSLPEEEYCWELHIYLKGLIVTKRPILSEVQRYDSKATDEITLQVFGNW